MITEELPAPQRRAAERLVPYKVHVVVTYKCNLACAHCYQAEHDSDDLSIAELERVFDELAALGTLFLTLGGGEPLARKDFWTIVEAARKRRFAIDLFTNATLVTPEVAVRLKAAGIVRVAVSLHGGHAMTHDVFVRRPGAFDRINRAVDALEAVGMPVDVKTNVTALNWRELPLLAERFAGRPLVQLKHAYRLFEKDDGDRAPSVYHATEAQERAVVRTQLAGYSRGKLEGILDTARLAQSRREDEHVTCQAARTAFALQPNGDMTPCTVTSGIVLGNVRREPIADAWRGSSAAGKFRAITFQSFQDERDECQQCEFRKVCNRCPALSQTESGSLTGFSPQVCQSTKVKWTEIRRRAAEEGLECPL